MIRALDSEGNDATLEQGGLPQRVWGEPDWHAHGLPTRDELREINEGLALIQEVRDSETPPE